MTLHYVLNGRPAVADIRPDQSLLEVLREAGCQSVRGGCETGSCGVCTLWVDEKPVLSCAYPAARAEGKRVTTVEGLPAEAEALTQALAAEGADQCGYCGPGFIMAALAMLRELKNPTEEEIRRYMAGNLCRCTGYASRMRALKKIIEGRAEI